MSLVIKGGKTKKKKTHKISRRMVRSFLKAKPII